MRGQPQLGLRRFMATTASMRSWSGPFGPGRWRRLGENKTRYFRLLACCGNAAEWKVSEQERNGGYTRKDEKRAQPGDDPICSTQVGRTLAPAIEGQQLMP